MKQEILNRRLIISLAVLVSVTALLFFFSGNETTEKPDASLFKVDDLRSIDKVVLQSTKGKIQLSYNGSRWMVNENYNADTRMIEVLFATLQQAEPRRRVAAIQADSIASNLKARGVTVSLYTGETMVKQFMAGGNEGKTQAYFLGDDIGAYLMSIPGYKVYVSGIFELNESGFRNKYIFDFNWQNFKSLQTNFPGNGAENFTASLNGKDFFSIEGLAQTDTAKLNTYLNDVSLLQAENFLAGEKADSLEKMQPYVTITISDLADRKYSLALYEPQANNKVLGLINRQPVDFDLSMTRSILKTRSFFTKK